MGASPCLSSSWDVQGLTSIATARA
jgi:hypothetical protein